MENRYTMLEAARKIGLKSKLTLYRWERANKIPAPKRLARNNSRIYTDGDIENIRKIMRIDEVIEPKAQPVAKKPVTKTQPVAKKRPRTAA